MNINWRDILGEISGYKPLYEAKALELHDAQARIDQLTTLLTAANETIRRLETTPCPETPTPAPTETTPPDPTPPPTAPESTTQETNMLRRTWTERVVDCPKEKRVVPLSALSAGLDHAQLTCRQCPFYKTETCNYVTCKYGG
jgi:hypothetical protein